MWHCVMEQVVPNDYEGHSCLMFSVKQSKKMELYSSLKPQELLIQQHSI